ncbi:MAG: CBS domain-containing protein, partial [Oscillospiraceae bacterium]
TMTVEQNICVVPKLLKYGKERCQSIVHELLELVEMPYEEYAHKYPNQLSGGQQQRIGVLRALAASPHIMLMDEPFGALDPMTRAVLQEEVRRLQVKLNKTVVFVTHDMDEALTLADTIIFMEKGKIVQMASPEEMLQNPATDLIRSFMGKRTQESAVPQTAADVMRTNVTSVFISHGPRQSVELMARRNIDTLLVKNADGTYAGTVSVQDIKNRSGSPATIEGLVRTDTVTVYTDEDVQQAFDSLLAAAGPYVVVLNRNNTIAGIITKTSVAKALADAVWGNE